MKSVRGLRIKCACGLYEVCEAVKYFVQLNSVAPTETLSEKGA